jgi:hypothetical protein
MIFIGVDGVPKEAKDVVIHELKIAPEYFEAVANGLKQFELRKDDRNFQVNDLVVLKEYDNGAYTGRTLRHLPIKYVLRNCPQYGLQDGYCIIGF